mmetsp:Transcript_27716/g.47987  ORF Transcript_27716/g.47987 Transcript_27716/m.47987 type:complete len:161 (+) Transcript_27716:1617-2099(+)
MSSMSGLERTSISFWGNVSGISLPSNEANGLLNLLSVPNISSCDGGAVAAETATDGGATIRGGRIKDGISILPESSVLPSWAFLTTEEAPHVALFVVVGCSSFLLSPPPERLTAPREVKDDVGDVTPRLASAEAAAKTNSSRVSLPPLTPPPPVVGLLAE